MNPLRLIVVAIVLGSAAIAQIVPAAQDKAVPFTLVQSITNESGAEVDRKITGRRSDGALAEIYAAGPPQYGLRVRAVSQPDGAYFAYYDSMRIKTTFPAPARSAHAETRNYRPTTCVNPRNHLVSREKVLSEDVEVIQEGNEGEASRVLLYQAPRLACISLKYKVMSGPIDKASGAPVSLDVGHEPDPKLFESPNYEEVRPSEVDKRLMIEIGHGEPIADPNHLKSANEADKQYDARRKR